MSSRKGLVVSCSYPRSTYSLEAPENDARFYEHMLKRFGFHNVRSLSDFQLGLQSSHRGNVLRAVQWLIQDAQPGDNLAFVFSGHGISTTCTTSERRDDLDRALMAADMEDPFPANLLFDCELQNLFSLLPAGVLLTCIIDAPCGDTVVRLPWFYDAKTGSFCGPPSARHSSLWPGDRYPRRPGSSNFTIRGGPTSMAKVGTAKPQRMGPCDLFPGVAAFLLCACRPDQVCLEALLPSSTQCYGLFTSSLAAALQQSLLHGGGVAMPGMTGGQQPRDADIACPLNYLQLARMIEDDLQRRVSKVGAPGLEQHILLGFSQDPSSCMFLQSPEQVCQLPRRLEAPAQETLPAGVLANLMAGSEGESRWPNLLVQLCSIDRGTLAKHQSAEVSMGVGSESSSLAKTLLSAEVLGEFWLPPLAHIFPEARLPGDPPMPPKPPTPRRAFRSPRTAAAALKSPRRPCPQLGRDREARSVRTSRKELWCRLRAPALGTQQQCCTWGAALRRDQFLSCAGGIAQACCRNCGTANSSANTCCGECGCQELERSSQVTNVGPGVQLGRLLKGAMGSRTAFAEAARKLRQGARGDALTSLEFEYFAVREMGLDLATARKAFASCLEVQARSNQGWPETSAVSSTLLAEAVEACTAAAGADANYILEARLEMEWRSTVGLGASAAAGEIRLFAAELRPRQLPKDSWLAQLNSREAELGYGRAIPSSIATLSATINDENRRPPPIPVAEPLVLNSHEEGTILFLRFSLCASRDVYPDAAEVTPRGMLATPRLNAPEASWIVPHIVFVSSGLLHTRLPSTGAWCAQMPAASFFGDVVPICTCARLCDAQRAGLALPREPQRPPDLPTPRNAEPMAQVEEPGLRSVRRPQDVRRLPPRPFHSKYLARPASDSQLPANALAG
mmetsp:Transcript_71209/g.170019  ORF Transcript_71209/g.170019 Transcript_71209/m.170019 type:complete len:906 (+) Transcript_71209:78-2795(+)